MADPYTPTGGQFNDPNTWQTDPSFGQTAASANYGAGYNPAYGSYDDFKAGRRANRAQFQPGGANYEWQQKVANSVYGAHPNTQQELGQYLNTLGIYHQKDMHQALYNQYMQDWNNVQPLGSNEVFANGQKMNVGTSDVNAGWSPMTAGDYAELNKGFYGRLGEQVGVGTFQNWQRHGSTGLTRGPDGYWHNNPGGDVYDNEGFVVDPTTGKRTGGSYLGDPAPVMPPGVPYPIGGTSVASTSGYGPSTGYSTTSTGQPNPYGAPASTSVPMPPPPPGATLGSLAGVQAQAAPVAPPNVGGYAPPQAYGSLGNIAEIQKARQRNPRLAGGPDFSADMAKQTRDRRR